MPLIIAVGLAVLTGGDVTIAVTEGVADTVKRMGVAVSMTTVDVVVKLVLTAAMVGVAVGRCEGSVVIDGNPEG
ncbi:MAG: hypothetical protein ACT4QE_19860 [Anaerolineales bacterium]